MAGVAYTLDGYLVRPRVVTIFQLWAKTSGSGHVRIEATSKAELREKYADGERRGIYIGVIGTGERHGYDPVEAAAYRAELCRVTNTSCALTEDYLPMRLFVKNLPAERCNEIDTTWLRGYQHIPGWLEMQLASKRHECSERGIIPAVPEYKPWWRRTYPWRDK